MHFLSEKLELILTSSNWLVFVYHIFHSINMSITWHHKFYWFWQSSLPSFAVILDAFEMLQLWNWKRYWETINSNLPDLLLFQMYPQRFSHQFPHPCTNFYDLIRKDMLAFLFLWISGSFPGVARGSQRKLVITLLFWSVWNFFQYFGVLGIEYSNYCYGSTVTMATRKILNNSVEWRSVK